MGKKFYKYLLFFILALLSCKDKSVEPLGIPDNYVIAYEGPGVIGDIFLYNSLTKSVINVTSNVVDTLHSVYVSSFSDDGHELLFTLDYTKILPDGLMKSGRSNIFYYNLITGKVKRMINPEIEGDKPRFSKDGKHIIYQSYENQKWNIYMIDSSGNNKHLVVSQGYSPQFLMNDQKILYTSYRNGKSEFYLNDINGSNEEQLTNNNLGGDFSVSSNSDFFVFSASVGIYKFDFNTKTPSLLIPNPNRSYWDLNLSPKISNDAKFIVYLNTYGSLDHIYLYDFERKDTIGLGMGFVADFTKDSKNVISLQRNGMHIYNIYSQRDSVLLPYQILSFDIAVSSIK